MLIIHGVPISVHTRKVIVAAIEKNLPYENNPVIPFHPPANWGELSPTGKIPVVADGDLVLRDSSVICAYLERVHPERALYPAQAQDYAQALWLEEYADGTLFREVVHGLFFQKIIRPNMLNQQSDPSVIAQIEREAIPKVFRYLESSIAGEFLAGGQFSIADIAVTSNLINFHYLGYGFEPQYSKLKAYFKECLQRRSIATALGHEAQTAAAMGLDSEFSRRLAE